MGAIEFEVALDASRSLDAGQAAATPLNILHALACGLSS
jgi:hypothetical protein